jgi:hypothetical protein
MCQLHLRATGLFVSRSKLSTESLGHQIVEAQSGRSYLKWSVRRKTQLHQKNNILKFPYRRFPAAAQRRRHPELPVVKVIKLFELVNPCSGVNIIKLFTAVSYKFL